jgi:hypothetical protein
VSICRRWSVVFGPQHVAVLTSGTQTLCCYTVPTVLLTSGTQTLCCYSVPTVLLTSGTHTLSCYTVPTVLLTSGTQTLCCYTVPTVLSPGGSRGDKQRALEGIFSYCLPQRNNRAECTELRVLCCHLANTVICKTRQQQVRVSEWVCVCACMGFDRVRAWVCLWVLVCCCQCCHVIVSFPRPQLTAPTHFCWNAYCHQCSRHCRSCCHNLPQTTALTVCVQLTKCRQHISPWQLLLCWSTNLYQTESPHQPVTCHILSHAELFRVLQSYFFIIHFSIILPSMSCFPK